MKKILLIGSGPLPIEKNTIGTAFGIRTWQFLKPLLQQKDVELHVILLAFSEKYLPSHPLKIKGQYKPAQEDLFINIFEQPALKRVQVIDKGQIKSPQFFQDLYDTIQPDLLVGINIHPAFLTSKIKRKCPFWADLNGWTMAEGQAQAALWQSDELLSRLWSMEKTVLSSLDRASTVSLPQKYATIGELAAVGRLNQWTQLHPFVEVIENAMDEELHQISLKASEFDESILEHIDYTPEQKIVLSIGAFNTWIDSKTLLLGLEKAMAHNKHSIFVNTGEGMPGLSQKHYEQFVEECKKSKYSTRIKNLGWVEQKKLNTLLQKATIGINVDLPIYETFFGARNRINEYLLWDLPVLTTKGSSIANTLINANAAIGIESQSSSQLAEKLCYYLDPDNQKELKSISGNAHQYKTTIYNIENTTKPLIDWVKNPIAAPDKNKEKPDLNKQKYVKQLWLYLQHNGLSRIAQKIFPSKAKR